MTGWKEKKHALSEIIDYFLDINMNLNFVENFVLRFMFFSQISVYLVQLMNGIGYGWLAPTLYRFKNSDDDISLTSEECAWIATSHLFGRSLGSFLIAPFGNTISRCLFILSVFTVNVITWPILLFFSQINAWYTARFIFGISCSVVDSILPIYMAETCNPKFRALFNVFSTVLFFGGELIAFTLPELFSYRSILQMYTIFSIVVFGSTFWLQEPAQFLIRHGKIEKAEKHFSRLRGPAKLNPEFERIVQNTMEEKSKTSIIALITSPENYKSMRIVFIINVFGCMTGFPALNTFTPMLFSSSESMTVEQFLILFGGIQFLSSFLFTFTIERFSRRSIALTGIAMVILIHTTTVALFYVHKNVGELPYFQWLIFFTVTAYASVYGMIIRPLLGLIRGELFPQSIQTYGSCIVSVGMSLAGAVMSRIFLSVPPEMNFIGYTFIGLVLFVYVYVELPETRNKSLPEIQDELKGRIVTKF